MDRIEVNVQTGETKVIQLTDAEINAAKEQYQTWLSLQPPSPPAPTLADLQAQLAALTAQINSLAGVKQ